MGTDRGTHSVVGLSGQDGLGNKVIREENIKGDGSIICVNIEMTKN